MLKKLLLIVVSLVILGGVGLGVLIMRPSKETIDPLTYFDEFKQGQQNMVYNDTRVNWQEPVLETDGMLYIESEWATTFVDERIFYDANEGILTLTNVNEVIRIDSVTKEVTVNNQVAEKDVPILVANNKLYIGAPYLEAEYAVAFTKGLDGRLVLASTTDTQRQTAYVSSKKAQIRTRPDKKATIVDAIEKGHQLVIYGMDETGYVRVRDENGMIGYISEKQIKLDGETTVKEAAVYTAKPLARPLEGSVKLAWDQMTVRIAGDWTSRKYTQIQGANVIAPTWFEFADADGNLMDRGSTDYVASARRNGLQVWALMSHNFTTPSYTREILTSTKKRQHVISQLVTYAKKYDLDGINIDIENIQTDFAREWVQFMRELYPQMQAIGVTVSVDVYMPSAWSRFYQRDKISEVVDYFIVMAYDQHWSGSEQAGPTAGLGWVEEGITMNLEEVPAEKLVLGIPFFTRVWREGDDGSLSSKPYGMVAAQNAVKEWGVASVYDDEHRQNYAEAYVDGALQKVWLEDLHTIEERIKMIERYNLAGYAVWKLGLEDSGVWDLLNTVK